MYEEFYSREFEKRGRGGTTMQMLEQAQREKMEKRAGTVGKPKIRGTLSH